MKLRLKLIVLSVVFYSFSSQVVYAQSELTLEDCIKIAHTNSLDIKKGMLSERGADINLKFAKHQLFPSLNSSSSLSYNVGRRIDPTTNSYISQSFISQGINLNTGVTLYNGGKLRNSIRKAILDKNASKEDVQQMKRDIALLVTNTYLSILYAQENLKNSKKQYESTDKRLKKLQKMIDAGLKPKSAALNIEAQLLSEEQKVVVSKNEVIRSYLDLKSILMINDSDDIIIKTPFIDLPIDKEVKVISLNELYSAALQHYPRYSAAKIRLKSGRIEEKIAKATFLPRLSLGGGVSTNYADQALEVVGYNKRVRENIFIINNVEVPVGIPYAEPITKKQGYFNQLESNLGFGMALKVNIPIYNNYMAKSSLQRAKINTENLEISKKLIEQNIKSKIQLAFSDSQAAKSQYIAAKKAFDAQKAAFDNAKLQYDVGVIGSYDLINAKLLYEKSENSLLLAKYQYVFKSKILDFYLGENLSFK